MRTIGSLFSGAGGLDMAVEQLFDAETIWHCEADPAASKVLAARWPGIPNLGDITQVDWESVPPVDILCGGFPCQDVSLAAVDRRAGLTHGTRSGLWAYMAEAIAVLQPSIVIIENVRGLLSARAHRPMESHDSTLGNDADGPILRALGAVLGDLSNLGHDAQWTTISAASVGACHGRDRVFIVAYPADRGGPLRSIAAPRDAVPAGGRLLPTPSSSDGIGGGPNDPINRLARGHQTQLIDLGMHPGDSELWARYAPAIEHWERLTRPAPSPTLPSPRGKYGARLNPAFAEWMMNWPAGWVTDIDGITRNDQLRIIGNGVVCAQAIAAVSFLTHLA